MADDERPIAVFAPSIRNIKLYADGRIAYQGKAGSVIGATASVEKSGEKHRLRDTREVVLRIDGPSVSIAAALPAAALQVHRKAEEFAARVNQMSNGVDRSAPAPAPAVPPAHDPPSSVDRPTQPETPVPAPADDSVSAPVADSDSALRSMDLFIGQLERLGKLRDSGVLTEDEFQAQKAALLRAAPK